MAEKAAALLHSSAQNHALIDGNKRLALAAAWTFCRINGGWLPDMTDDGAYDLVMGVAKDGLGVPDIADRLRSAWIG